MWMGVGSRWEEMELVNVRLTNSRESFSRILSRHKGLGSTWNTLPYENVRVGQSEWAIGCQGKSGRWAVSPGRCATLCTETFAFSLDKVWLVSSQQVAERGSVTY